MRRILNRAPLALAGFLICQACAVEPEPRVGSAATPIVDGVLESGMNAVAFLYNLDGAGCTASIVAPRAVLTAKHCVQQRGTSSAAPASNFRVFIGRSVGSVTTQHFVQEVRPAPGRWDLRDASDVAMLILSSPVRGIEPLELSFDESFQLVGDRITAVGYGQTPEGFSGTKYRTQKFVQEVSQGFVFVEPAVCSGDSGGPLIGPDGRVWGVASFIFSPDGSRPQCGTSPGAYNAIERYRDFIETVIEESGTCVADGDEVCNGADDDCDGEVDEGCTPLGEACSSSDECTGGQPCEQTEAGRICTQRCDPMQPEVGCPPDMYCASTAGCDGLCVPGGRAEAPKGLGQDCVSDRECVTLFCHDPGDGRSRCLQPCRGDDGMCLADEVCAAAPGDCSGCVARELVIGARGLGEPCSSGDDCGSSLCFAEEGLSYCSRGCTGDDDCGGGFHCRDTTDEATGQSRALCIRGPRESIGGGCVSNGDCGDGYICASRGETRWCTELCNGECPAGFSCEAAGGASVCAPAGGLVGESCGEGLPECISGLCAQTPNGQVCTRFCGPDAQCSPGFECVRVDDQGTAVCVKPQPPSEEEGGGGGGGGGGGCAIAPGQGSAASGGPAGALGVLLAWLGWRRRRR